MGLNESFNQIYRILFQSKLCYIKFTYLGIDYIFIKFIIHFVIILLT